MKASFFLISLPLALTTVATPLGDRAIFRRHNGAPLANARRYILESRMEPPPACVNKASNTVNATGVTDPSSTTAVPTSTDVPTSDGAVDDTSANVNDDGSSSNNSTVSDTNNSTISDTGNSTVSDANNNSTISNTDNSTVSDATNSTARRRHLTARLAQLDLPDVAMGWQKLCLVSGGDIYTTNSPCVQLAGLGGIDALLAEADPCAQQDIADAMITFAKSSGIVNRDDLIAYAIEYRKHPRNAINILGVIPASLYCQKLPVNPELVGIVNGQLDGVTPGLYGSPTAPIVPFGANGTCPLGTTPDISSCSCVDVNSANGTDVSTDSADNSTATLDPTDSTATSSADNSTVSADATATNTADNATVTGNGDSTDSATADVSAETVTDAATATSSADDAAATDSSDAADTSSTADVASATDAAVTSSATDTANTADAAPAATAASPAQTSGPNFQPSDISGDVNDPNGRR